jgi:hypothetical protein
MPFRREEALPDAVAVVPWPSAATRATLSSAAPVGLIVFLSLGPGSMAGILGLSYLGLGAALCCSAVLAGRTERRRHTRVVRIDNRFYLAP